MKKRERERERERKKQAYFYLIRFVYQFSGGEVSVGVKCVLHYFRVRRPTNRPTMCTYDAIDFPLKLFASAYI